MFAHRERKPIVELNPGQERTFRFPPMSEGPVIINVHDADFTTRPNGDRVLHNGLASDPQVTLFRPGLEVTDANSVMATSLWKDSHWRLKLRRSDSVGLVSLAYARMQVKVSADADGTYDEHPGSVARPSPEFHF